MNNKENFIQSVFSELKKVTWPTRRETINYVIAVLVISIVTAAILGGLDWVYELLLNKFVF
jgi:preprotein translocase subunit SecE